MCCNETNTKTEMYNMRHECFDITKNYALLIDSEKKCNLEMIKIKKNPVRFISFDIYL